MTLVLTFILFSDVSEEEFRLLCTLISLIAKEEGINEKWGDLTPNLLHKINEEGGKIYEINKRGRKTFFEEGAK